MPILEQNWFERLLQACAAPGLFAPITIQSRRCIDGGFRSGTNADLAKGHGRVLIVSLLSTRGLRVPLTRECYRPPSLMRKWQSCEAVVPSRTTPVPGRWEQIL